MSLKKRLCLLHLRFIQRQQVPATAAFECLFIIAGVRQPIFQAGEKKRAELSLPRIGPQVNFILQQVNEKTLGKIFGIVRRMPAPADESVERRPIGLAKLSQRSLGRLRFRLLLARS